MSPTCRTQCRPRSEAPRLPRFSKVKRATTLLLSLIHICNDVSGAYQSYRRAVNDELLARQQLERQQLLFDKGAIAKSALEQAVDVAENAKAGLDAAGEQLRLLGIDKDHPSGIVDIFAPISGVITDQQVTNASGVQGLGSPNPYTISDLSYVWIVCDVYENDLDACLLYTSRCV